MLVGTVTAIVTTSKMASLIYRRLFWHYQIWIMSTFVWSTFTRSIFIRSNFTRSTIFDIIKFLIRLTFIRSNLIASMSNWNINLFNTYSCRGWDQGLSKSGYQLWHFRNLINIFNKFDVTFFKVDVKNRPNQIRTYFFDLTQEIK